MPGLPLTAEIAALAERTEPDPGPEPGTEERNHDDFVAFTDRLLAEYAPSALRVFAYGSLIWNPEFEVKSAIAATVVGWHRSFCFSLTQWRGTRELPGLMMALDRGGSCRGLVLELDGGIVRDQPISLMDRELDAKRPTNVPKWIWVNTAQGKVRALTFVANTHGSAYGRAGPRTSGRHCLAGCRSAWHD